MFETKFRTHTEPQAKYRYYGVECENANIITASDQISHKHT
jgi:hypothetical protein